ncbi:MAG: peptidase [Alphaproteobacteria bacterium]|nr:MAG: peptidase [Alphaproteobacteria bacterium]
MNGIGERVVAEARRWLGTPYRHQSCARGVGCDCLGLVRGVWRAVAGDEPPGLPAYTPDWGEVGAREHVLDAAARHLLPVARDRAGPGDLVVFRWRAGAVAKHLGILSAPDRFIHACERAGVVEVALIRHWAARIAGTFRFPDRT